VSSLKANNNNVGPYRKPRADLYTALLAIALLALLLGILCLYLEMKAYQFEFKGRPLLTMQSVEAGDQAVESSRGLARARDGSDALCDLPGCAGAPSVPWIACC